VDSHNSGLLPQIKYFYHLGIVYRFIQRKADVTIVTNKFLADYVKNNGGTAFVLPDKIPEVGYIKKIKLNNKASILYICSFGSDETYLELIKAAVKIKNVNFFITGDNRKKNVRLYQKITPNIFFTGYLPDSEYWSMLRSVNLAVDLTNREHCLVCGAYEAVAVGTPLILSDTHALKSYFYKGAVYVSNNAESISQQIITGLKYENKLRQEIIELKKELSAFWQKRFNNLKIHLEEQ
jgi:glycosyltransferase involved in cell wall biosynthesis